MGMDEHNDDGLGGRSRTRREISATGRFAATLAVLPDWHLAQVPLSERIRTEVDLSRRITSHIAKKRQLGYVDRLLRELDEAQLWAIEAAIGDPEGAAVAGAAEVASWRQRLLAGGDDAVEALLAEHPRLERQQVRQRVRNAAKGGRGAAKLDAWLQAVLAGGDG